MVNSYAQVHRNCMIQPVLLVFAATTVNIIGLKVYRRTDDVRETSHDTWASHHTLDVHLH